MIQIQPISATTQLKQKGNCGNCQEQKYLYECSLCQFEYCRTCAKSIQMWGHIYNVCYLCLATINDQWGYQLIRKSLKGRR